MGLRSSFSKTESVYGVESDETEMNRAPKRRVLDNLATVMAGSQNGEN